MHLISSRQALLHLGTCLLLSAQMQACKNTESEDNETLSISGDLRRKIDDDIKSFNDTQKALIDANKRGISACDKFDIMWRQVLKTRQDEADMVPPDAIFKDVVTFGNGSANRFWRIFEGWNDTEGGSEIRPYETDTRKFIRLTHRYSVMAKLKFVVEKDTVKKLGYTGHYAEGNDCVLGRFSSAVPTNVEDRFTPAFSAKFFVGGSSESQVLIAQHDIGGQSSGTDYTVDPPVAKTIDNNFYKHHLSNRLSFEKGVYSGVAAFSRFLYTTQYFASKFFNIKYAVDPRELQANHLAEKSATGALIDKNVAKGPRFVWLVAPNAEFRDKFAKMAASDRDFRKHFLSLNKDIANGPVTVYRVYGSDTWTYNPEQDASLIGRFVTDSNFVVSEAADVRLFFKHSIQFVRIPEDEGKPSPYTQDFPYSEWGDELFTSNCRLGVLEQEIIPTSADDLDGSFLEGAIVNSKTRRYNTDGSYCFKGFVKGRLEDALTPYLHRF